MKILLPKNLNFLVKCLQLGFKFTAMIFDNSKAKKLLFTKRNLE